MPYVGPPPNLTTTQRDALSAADKPKGMIVYNTTTSRLEVNDGTGASPTWNAVGGNAAQYGTALPTTSLANGQVFTLFVSGASAYSTWQCMYRTDLDSTYPWHVMGGSPYHISASSGTLPRGGRYIITAKGWLGNGGTTTGGDLTGNLTLGGSTIDQQNDNGPPGAYSGTGNRGFTSFSYQAEAAAAAGTTVAIDTTGNPHITLFPLKII